jgi:TPR repeat protein
MAKTTSRACDRAASSAAASCFGFIAFSLLILLAGPARADFHDGLQAYDAGDYETALEEWRPAAVAGDADAQMALASMYRQGIGVRQNWQRAVNYYRAAALQGHVSGQLNLGDLFATGQGVPRDLVRAYAWLSLAAEQKHSWAIDRLADVKTTMSTGEIAAAERLAAGLLN